MKKKRSIKKKLPLRRKKDLRGGMNAGVIYVIVFLLVVFTAGILFIGGTSISIVTPKDGQLAKILAPTMQGSKPNLQLYTFDHVTIAPTMQTGWSGECAVSEKLVNTCRPWLGATARNYPEAQNETKAQLLAHEQRIGRQLDIVHTYHPIGTNTLSDVDRFFATRQNTYLFANWKPTDKWAKAGGGNSQVNAGIDQMARSIKSIAPKKIFLTIHHEAENDVSGGGTCKSYKGNAGTTTEYRAMWRNVSNRFKAAGATNVVWVIDYMNYAPWNCVVNELYPGDDIVDWIMFNAYGQGSETWSSQVNNLYSFLTKNSNAQHNYLSKPWGIIEWSINRATVEQRKSYYDQVKNAVVNNTFPQLKAYVYFDERDRGSESGEDFRIAYDQNGNYNQSLQDSYNAFAKHPFMIKK